MKGLAGFARALDEGFSQIRFDRLTPAEKKYLRAMAELELGAHRSGDIVAIPGCSPAFPAGITQKEEIAMFRVGKIAPFPSPFVMSINASHSQQRLIIIYNRRRVLAGNARQAFLPAAQDEPGKGGPFPSRAVAVETPSACGGSIPVSIA
jgi:hypothetical protein